VRGRREGDSLPAQSTQAMLVHPIELLVDLYQSKEGSSEPQQAESVPFLLLPAHNKRRIGTEQTIKFFFSLTLISSQPLCPAYSCPASLESPSPLPISCSSPSSLSLSLPPARLPSRSTSSWKEGIAARFWSRRPVRELAVSVRARGVDVVWSMSLMEA
jgi:hypothetical protein